MQDGYRTRQALAALDGPATLPLVCACCDEKMFDAGQCAAVDVMVATLKPDDPAPAGRVRIPGDADRRLRDRFFLCQTCAAAPPFGQWWNRVRGYKDLARRHAAHNLAREDWRTLTDEQFERVHKVAADLWMTPLELANRIVAEGRSADLTISRLLDQGQGYVAALTGEEPAAELASEGATT